MTTAARLTRGVITPTIDESVAAAGVVVDGTKIKDGGVLATGICSTTDGVASGTVRRIGGVAYRAVAASTAQLGTVETEVVLTEKYPVPANTLKAGTVVWVRAQGTYTATTGSETLSLILKLGTIALLTIASVDPASADMFYIDALIQVRTAGAGGTLVACGTALAQGATAVGTAKPWFLGETAVDTTGAMDLGVYIDRQASAADTDSLRLDIFVVKVFG